MYFFVYKTKNVLVLFLSLLTSVPGWT